MLGRRVEAEELSDWSERERTEFSMDTDCREEERETRLSCE